MCVFVNVKFIGGAIGAIALIQLQEDMKKQLSAEGNYTEEELEEYMQSHKKLMIDSLWKLNVADIEATLSRVCQMVFLLVRIYYWLLDHIDLDTRSKLFGANLLMICFRFFKITVSRKKTFVRELRV